MAPPPPSPLLPLLLLLTAMASTCSAAVFTVDLGSEALKVAVVNPKPGRAPIDIAINEMSKRKSPAIVAISNGDRLLSEEAIGIAARYPDRVFSRLRDFIGRPLQDVLPITRENYLPYKLSADAERSTVKILGQDGETEYTAEELLALILDYAHRLAEGHVKGTVTDAVVSVPPYFGQSQRQGILDAAQMVGISVLGLIQEHAGVALQYGIDKDFSNGSKNVVIYDMGANSVYAAVIHYSAYMTRDRGKNVSSNQFQVKGVRWDSELGGQTLERKLLEYFADEFNKKSGLEADVRTSPKAMAKLRKEVKRTKEILSANTEAPLSAESLFEDVDFRTSITREKFEDLCSEFWSRAVQPLKQVLEDVNMTVADIDAFELVGGATRVPKLQSVLTEFLGDKKLDRHLDADEALALGSSLFAANMSDSFKLNRRIGMIDGLPYGILFKVQQSEEGEGSMAAGEEAAQQLFPRLKKLPTKVMRSLKEQVDDFTVELLYDVEEPSPKPLPSRQIKHYQISGVANASAKYKEYNLTAPLKTSLHFSLSRSGIVAVDKAELVAEFHEWVEVAVEPPAVNVTVNGTGSTSNVTEEERGNAAGESDEGVGEADTSETSTTSEDGSNSSSSEEEAKGSVPAEGKEGTAGEGEKPIVKKKLRKRTVRVVLKVTDISEGVAKPMAAEVIKAAKQRLEKLAEREREKRETEEAKNSLEAFIYAKKDKMEQDEQAIKKVTTSKERDTFTKMLNEAEEWLYMDGENAASSEFRAKLSDLTSFWNKVSLR